jgi:alkylhydroperoxidase/carboxymuconolactone decarboxylase family protein YurZ
MGWSRPTRGNGRGAELDQNIAKLRDLAETVDALVDCPTSASGRRPGTSALDPKTDALIRVGALVALGATPTSYLGAIRSALNVGASPAEIVDTLVAVSTTVGLARVVSASGGVAVALGYDIDAAFEEHRPSSRRQGTGAT